MNITETINKLKEAKLAYYNDKPIMSDSEFDALEDALRATEPHNPYFSIVGTSANLKVKHDLPMLSMGKAKTIEEVYKWLEKVSCKNEILMVEGKIDGLSCDLLYIDGKLNRISTRGDGQAGQDITHIKEYIKIPMSIPETGKVHIRGELVIPRDTTMDTEGKPLRNIAVGLINRKSDRDQIKYLKFIAYQYIGKEQIYTENIALMTLSQLGFEVVWNCLVFSQEDLKNTFNTYIESLRESLNYETDGLTIIINDKTLHEEIDSKYVVEHHHHYNIALKPISETSEALLIDIEWNVSRFGNIIPTAIFTEVIIQKRKITRASLSNYKNVLKMRLEKWDKILISLSNEVIPYVEKNITKEINQR